jgi:DNA-binding PadR family transcriptional regulator
MMAKRRYQTRIRNPADTGPMRPIAFAVLAALADGPVAGFEVMERVNAATAGRPILGPGTLYRLLRDLRREGLIERTAAPEAESGSEDERRTYHGLTREGRRALLAEAARLRRTLEAAGLLEPKRS